MDNSELIKIINSRQEAREKLVTSLSSLKGVSPMAVLTGQINLDDVLTDVMEVCEVTENLIEELVQRELARELSAEKGFLEA